MFTLTEKEDGIYTLVFDTPSEKVNKLSLETLEQLEKLLDDLCQKENVKAVIFLSGKKDQFVAGADIKQFGPAFKDPAFGQKLIETGQRVFYKISKLPFPFVAAIDGVALGGGCELALACSHRIATDNPKTLIGLPETTLGIIPGWGGTQRLPRLLGLKLGTEMIVTGKPVSGLKALKIGLVDALSPPEFLQERALKFVKALPPRKKDKKDLLYWLRPIFFAWTRREILKKTKGFYPAPLLALKVIQETCALPIEQGLLVEAKAFIQNASENVGIAKNLIALFFGQDALKKVPKGSEIKNAGILGVGTMGGGIAWLFSKQNIPARLKDISWGAIGHGTKAAWKVYQKLVQSRRLTSNEASLKFHTLSWTLDYTGFEKLDFILESAVENIELKRKIYAEVEACSSAILATNTSSLKIADLAEGLKRPERFIGMHFFNPATKMPLVEVIPGPKTSPETLAAALTLAKTLGKIPLVVGDCNGFLVNRIFMAAACEAFYFLEEGISIEALDQAMLSFGMPMGSCELADEVGIDVTYKVAKVLEKAYGERMRVPDLLQKIYDKGLLGKKSGRGFYLYRGKKKTLNPDAVALLGKRSSLSQEEIRERVLLAMINEASHCLEEKVVAEPKLVDLAMVLGAGFPPFRGGPLRYADTLGLPYVLSKLQALPQTRFRPTKQIEAMAKDDRTFYSE